jgi:hypothetical protein
LPIIYRPGSIEKSLSICVTISLPNFVHFVVSKSNAEYFAMDIINAGVATNPSLLKFKIGGATLVFEKVGKWKYHFKSLIVRSDT